MSIPTTGSSDLMVDPLIRLLTAMYYAVLRNDWPGALLLLDDVPESSRGVVVLSLAYQLAEDVRASREVAGVDLEAEISDKAARFLVGAWNGVDRG